MSDKANIWDKLPGESLKAHEAFKTYIDMGAARSLSKLAQSLGKSKALVAQWSVRHDWQARLDAWAALLNDEWARDRKRQACLAGRRHASVARAYISRLRTKLKSLDLDTMSASDMARWLDVAVKVERLSLGMSTSVVAGAGEGGEIEHKHIVAIREAEHAISRRMGIVLAGCDAPGVVPGDDD